MRLICSLVFSAFPFAQSGWAPSTFPAPERAKWHDWRGPNASLSDSESALFSQAFQKDIVEVEQSQNSCQIQPGDVHTVAACLGKLGTGIIVSVTASCMCGAAGNCAISAYVREKKATGLCSTVMTPTDMLSPLRNPETAFQTTLLSGTFLREKAS